LKVDWSSFVLLDLFSPSFSFSLLRQKERRIDKSINGYLSTHTDALLPLFFFLSFLPLFSKQIASNQESRDDPLDPIYLHCPSFSLPNPSTGTRNEEDALQPNSNNLSQQQHRNPAVPLNGSPCCKQSQPAAPPTAQVRFRHTCQQGASPHKRNKKWGALSGQTRRKLT